MRFRPPDGTPEAVSFDYCNSVLIVADKYEIQISDLAELVFSFLKHKNFKNRTNELGDIWIRARTLFFIKKKRLGPGM